MGDFRYIPRSTDKNGIIVWWVIQENYLFNGIFFIKKNLVIMCSSNATLDPEMVWKKFIRCSPMYVDVVERRNALFHIDQLPSLAV